MKLCLSIAALLLALAGAAAAQGVVLSGRMGERALLVVDGRAQTAAIGDSVGGLRLKRWAGEALEVERDGTVQQLRIGGTPAQMAAAAPRTSAREVVLTAGPGGHFTASGAINGRPVRFMVDTGATQVALSRAEAQRLGIDLTGATIAVTHTANGAVAVQRVTLGSVRVGDIELTQVGAVVLPQPMPVVLLGNSFLSRLQMRRDNDVMRLELR